MSHSRLFCCGIGGVRDDDAAYWLLKGGKEAEMFGEGDSGGYGVGGGGRGDNSSARR